MKHKRFIFLAIFTLYGIITYSQNSPFSGWHKYPFIESTYITKAMFDMAPDVKIGNTTLKELSGILDQVEIYRNLPPHVAKDGWKGEDMKVYAVNIGKRNGYEMALSLTTDNTEIIFYVKRARENRGIIRDLIVIRLEPTKNQHRNCIAIRLVGNFTFKDIRNIVGKK